MHNLHIARCTKSHKVYSLHKIYISIHFQQKNPLSFFSLLSRLGAVYTYSSFLFRNMFRTYVPDLEFQIQMPGFRGKILSPSQESFSSGRDLSYTRQRFSPFYCRSLDLEQCEHILPPCPSSCKIRLSST